MGGKVKNSAKKQQKSNLKFILTVVAIAVAVLAISVLFFKRKSEGEFENYTWNDEITNGTCDEFPRLKYWSITIQNFNDYAISLRSHNRVFSRLNYDFVNASYGDDWDILWTREYPWEFDHKLFEPLKARKLLQHQKVNHFPDLSALVHKQYMNEKNSEYDFILPSFTLPQDKKDFQEYLKKNPEKKILEKNFYNRGVQIVDVTDLKPKEDFFYQEFMDNPFLIDGHAFDFGVYVLITSFDPIRAYRFADDNYIRFCTAKYHPFDANNRDKYVVKDGSIHFTEMPSFKENYEKFKFGAKYQFERLIKQQGFDVKKFWERIDRAIATLVKNSERDVLKYSKKLNLSTHHFFELVRFDVILDAELNPFVVEVNLSPNLTPAQKSHEENSLIYEQLIYNVVKMIGGSSFHEFHSRFDSTDSIVSNYKNLATSPEICLKPECSNCSRTFCKICHPCMSSDVRYQLSEAFREHQNSANFKRVFPTENHFNDEKLISKMTKKNQIQMRWFKGKWEEDRKWC